MAGLEDSQVNAIMVQTRAKAGRLTNSLRNLKGQLTKEVNNCYKKIAHFKTLLSSTRLATSVVKTEYARGLLECHTRCENRFEKVERGIADLQELESEAWEGSVEDLDEFLTKLDTESATCYKQFHDVKADNAETFDTCHTLTAPAKHPMARQAQAVPNITPMGFKPQSDLKPTFLIKDCTLPEFNKFSETFVTYMRSSGSNVPAEAIYSNLLVHMECKHAWVIKTGG